MAVKVETMVKRRARESKSFSSFETGLRASVGNGRNCRRLRQVLYRSVAVDGVGGALTALKLQSRGL